MSTRRAPRFAARKDHSQTEVIQTLEALGCSVKVLPSIENSLPDLLVGLMGRLTYVVEVKNHADPEAGIEQGRFTKAQDTFWQLWRGNPKVVLHDRDEAIAFVQQVRGDY